MKRNSGIWPGGFASGPVAVGLSLSPGWRLDRVGRTWHRGPPAEFLDTAVAQQPQMAPVAQLCIHEEPLGVGVHSLQVHGDFGGAKLLEHIGAEVAPRD